jgi:hypothetical protein
VICNSGPLKLVLHFQLQVPQEEDPEDEANGWRDALFDNFDFDNPDA